MSPSYEQWEGNHPTGVSLEGTPQASKPCPVSPIPEEFVPGMGIEIGSTSALEQVVSLEGRDCVIEPFLVLD